MSTQDTTATRSDDVLAQAGRWLLAKVWLGCLLSAAYAAGQQFGWPQFLLTMAGTLGAVLLAMAALWLPVWTRERTTGIAPVDIGMRAVVWAGLVAVVVALLIGTPGVGTVAGALLITTAWRSFARRPAPFLNRRRPIPVRRPTPATRARTPATRARTPGTRARTPATRRRMPARPAAPAAQR